MATSARTKKTNETKNQATDKTPGKASDNERPLVEDIRLLGRILGDVIREQEGVAAYELIEQVRKLSVAFRRDADQLKSDKALKKLLKRLVRRPDRQRDSGVYLLQPPGQSGRRPAPHSPPRHSRAGRRHPGRQHRRGSGPPALGGHLRPKPSPTRWHTALCPRC